MNLSPPQRELLRTLWSWDDSCRRADLRPPTFWGTDGLGGGRVAKPLERRGLLKRGVCLNGHQGARLTAAGRDLAESLFAEGS